MRQRTLMNLGNTYFYITIQKDEALFDIFATKYGFRIPKVLSLVTVEFIFINYYDYSKILPTDLSQRK